MKYYFENIDSERCYSIDYFYEQLNDNELTEMRIYPAKIIYGEFVAWCTKYNDAIETQRGDCGRICEDYKPRNGKNGRCKFSNNCYEPSDKPILITIKDK